MILIKNKLIVLSVLSTQLLSTNVFALVPSQDGIDTKKKGRYEHTYIDANSPILVASFIADGELKQKY
jgi:hypothetical protein